MKRGYFYIILILTICIFQINVSSALVDCSQCHTSEPGKSATKASNTITIDACVKCHNPEYPPTPIGYNTHLAHVGKFSAKVNFLMRHPSVTASLQCGDCHKQVFDCTNCHVVGIPHVPPPLGNNCPGCHGKIDDLFKHPTIGNLVIHNIFHVNSTKDCQMCHNPDSMKSLQLASGGTVPITQAYNLCKQCHSIIFNSWDNGQHYANKTMPTGIQFAEDPAIKSDWEGNWQSQNSCVNCHNPHNPSQLYELPPPIETQKTTSSYIYAIPIIAIIIIVVFISLKYGMKNFIGSVLSLTKNITLPKFKLPKLSIPISISVEEMGKTDMDNNEINTISEDTKGIGSPNREIVDKGKSDSDNIKISEIPEDIKGIVSPNREIVDKGIVSPNREIVDKGIVSPNREIVDKGIANNGKISVNISNKRKKLLKIFNKGDILFISGIIAMFALFYIIFGTFMPMTVAISESMRPHMEKGDLIFYADISRINNIKTFDEGLNGGNSFDGYGDVIIYRPFGQNNITPIIHRAMYYVNKGDPMWTGGPIAPTDGYITKGDNNPSYDQQFSASNLQPVKKEWIIGVARYRIPYIGYIRILI